MSPSTDLKPVLDFLGQLQLHNDRAWFEEHRDAYETARERFEAFVERLIEEFSAFEDLSGVTAKDCVMRIYRDVRFSKDKSPYRTNMGAMIGPGGRKSCYKAYYVHLEPHGESMLAGGLHMPTGQQLASFRRAIDEDAAAFKAIIGDKDFQRHFGTLGGEKLKTAPQGYSRDHPDLELLQLKQVLALRRWPDDAVVSPRFPAQVVTAARALKPFLDYLEAVLP